MGVGDDENGIAAAAAMVLGADDTKGIVGRGCPKVIVDFFFSLLLLIS